MLQADPLTTNLPAPLELLQPAQGFQVAYYDCNMGSRLPHQTFCTKIK